MITVTHLSKVFHSGADEINALRNVTFTVPSGQFVAITGRSGSGKSTLLYQMSALDTPTSGSIVINDTDITTLTHKQRTDFRLAMLGYVFQDYALLPELTAAENVMVPLLMRGMSHKDARIKAYQALVKVDLGDRLEYRPTQLSGGQQQRVSIARAIGHDPEILFADEPTANLDSETSKTVLDIFRDLHKNKQTILMVTHEKEYARLAERIIELSDGEIVSDEFTK